MSDPQVAEAVQAGIDADGHERVAEIRAELENMSAEQLGVLRVQHTLPDLAFQAGAVLDCVADITSRPLTWVWPHRIPAGKLSLLVGDPGLGKSCLTLDLAARITRGAPWPDDCGRCEIGNIVLLSAEDDPEDTIKPRLEAAGADLGRIFILRSVIRADGKEHAFELTEDLTKLRACITEETRLVIVDPLSAYMGGSIDSHRDTSVRAALAPLAQLAAVTHVAILSVSHLNKSGRAGIYRIQGSIAFSAAARAVWSVNVDPDDNSRRLFLMVKNNLAREGAGLRFKLDDADGKPVVHWGEEIYVDARTVMEVEAETRGRTTDKPGARKEVLDLLKKTGRPLRGREIAEALDKTENAVWKIITKLTETGQIEHGPGGYRPCV